MEVSPYALAIDVYAQSKLDMINVMAFAVMEGWRIKPTHGNAQERYYDLNRRYGVHGDFNAGTLGDPVESVKCQDKTEEILEYDHHSEAFNGKITWGGTG